VRPQSFGGAGAHPVASFGWIDAGRCGDRISAVLIAHRQIRNGDIQPRLRLSAPASAKELKTIGMSVGSLSNPYFIALAEGATNAAKKINPDPKLIVVSSEHDLGKQFSQMDNFIAAGVDLILVAADDPPTR
jgi:ABC-type sugar transport system substrate-binding protein